MFHLKPFVTNTNLLIILVFSALIIPFSTVHADDSTRIEECNTSELSYWRMDDPIYVEDGYCFTENKTEISFTDNFTDFKLSFDTRLSPYSDIVIRIVNYSGYSLMLSISPTEIRLYKFVLTLSGNYSSETDFFRSTISLNPTDLYHFDLKHDNGKTQVFLNDELIDQTGMMDSIDAYMIRMFFTGGVEFDNLAFENIIVSPIGSPPIVLEPELRETFIVFRKNDDTLWKVHPDGSGLEQIITYGDLYNFSLDGKYLAIHSNNWKLIDIETNTIMPGWDSGLSTSQLVWINTGQLLSIIDDQEIHIYDVGSTSPVRKINLPKPTDDSDFFTTRITDIHPSPTMPYILGLFWNEGEEYRLGTMNLVTEEIRLLPGLSTGIYNIGYWSIDGTKLHFPKITVDFPSIDWKEKTTDLKTAIYSQDGSGGLYAYEGSLAPNGEHFVYSNNGRITVLNIDLIPDNDYYDPLTNTGRLTPGSNSDFEIVDGYNPIWQPRPSINRTKELNQDMQFSPTETWGATFATKTPKWLISETEVPNTTNRLTGSSINENESDSTTQETIKRKIIIRLILSILLLSVGIFLFSVAIILIIHVINLSVCKKCGRKNNLSDKFCGYCGTNIDESKTYPLFNNIRLLSLMLGFGFLAMSFGIFFTSETLKQNHASVSDLSSSVIINNNAPTEKQSSDDLGIDPISQDSVENSENLQVCQSLNFSKDTIQEVYKKIGNQDFDKIINDEITDEETCNMGHISFSPSRDYLLLVDGWVGLEYGWMVLYTIKDGKPLWSRLQPSGISVIVWSPDESKIAARRSNGWSIYDVVGGHENGTELIFIEDSLRTDEWGTLSDPENIVWTNNDTVVRKISNGIQFINVITGEISEVTTTDNNMVGGEQSKFSEPTAYFDWSNNGEYFITVIPNDLIIKLWESRTGKLVWDRTIENFSEGGTTVDWSPDNKYIAFGQWNRILIIDSSTGNLLYMGPHNTQSDLWSPDGKKILATPIGKENDLSIVDITTGDEVIISPEDIVEVFYFGDCTWLSDGRIVVEIYNNKNFTLFPNIWIVNPSENRWVEFSEASFDG